MNALWIPTHEITHGNEKARVMLTNDNVAYTRKEWDSVAAADYEVNDAGEWTFQGQPFTGSVRMLTDADRTQRLYREAEARVRGDDRLAPHAETILDDHADGDDHWQWVIDAEADEIVSWAEFHR